MLDGVYDYCSIKNTQQIKMQSSFNPSEFSPSVYGNYLFNSLIENQSYC
jgi:hypothetical protein